VLILLPKFFLLTNTDVYVNFESSGFDFGDNAVEGAPNLAGYRWKDAEDKWWYFASGSMGNSFGKKSLWHWTGDVIKIEFGANIAEAISRDIFFMIRSGGYRDVVKVTVFSAK